MTYDADAAQRSPWRIAETVFGVPALVGAAMQRVVPLHVPHGMPRLALHLLGVTIAVAGVGIVVAGRRALARHHQPTDPGRATTQLVTTGIYHVSRNPLYLGAACVVMGIGLAVARPWIALSVVPAVVACRFLLIVPEERYLEGKFGEPYRDYARTVGRWLGRRAP